MVSLLLSEKCGMMILNNLGIKNTLIKRATIMLLFFFILLVIIPSDFQ
jgi:hypothetical protein